MSMKHWLAALLLWPALTVAATAAPTLKALLVDGQANPFHEWRKTSPIVKRALEETGLFTVEVATVLPGKAKDFKPKFNDYQVVVLNYEGEEWPAATKKAFEAYVAGGGGLVVFHAADNAFAHWKAYNEMIGVGGWEGRNEKNGPFLYWQDGKIIRDTSPGGGGQHGAQHAYQLVVRRPEHPVMKGLPEKFRHAPDELYAKLRGPAKNLTVLATAFSAKSTSGTGRNEPALMAIDYGKGRVFHSIMGHGPQQCLSVAFIVTLQRGAEWAATGKVTQKVPDDFPGPDKPVVRDWEKWRHAPPQ